MQPRRTLSRRSFLGAGLAGIGSLASGGVLAACDDAQSKSVKFFNWQDYIDQSVLSDFTARTKLSVSYSTYASNDELADRLALAGVRRRGNRKRTSFDLIVPSDNLFRTLRTEGELKALDSSIVTPALLSNLAPPFTKLDFDPGNRFSIPWATGTTGIGYDKRLFDTPPSWSVFADPAHTGKMTLLNEAREALGAALLDLSEDPNTTNPKAIAAAEKRLVEMLKHSRLNSATYLSDLATGAVVVAQAFSTDVAQAKRKNSNLEFVLPDAGAIAWIDVLCIPKDAPNPKGAHQFVAFMLEPKISAANAATLRVDTGNQAARAFLPADVLNDPMAFPSAEALARAVFLQPLDDTTTKLIDDAWARITKQ
jgi:spermidine/putrescine-binding protein